MVIILSASLAISKSWVTSTIVWLNFFAASFISLITSRPVFSSKLPVGSSANTIAGLDANARAIATLCFSPPESSSG